MLSQVLSGGLMWRDLHGYRRYQPGGYPEGPDLSALAAGLLDGYSSAGSFGGLPEGVSYSILIMNTLVWAIDKKTHPRKFGYQLDKAKKGGAVNHG